MASLDHLTLRRPDDWHAHLRDGAMLKTVVPFTARAFARAIVMPNLASPITTQAMAESYRARILSARPQGSDFVPLMTCYLTDDADPDEIECGFHAGIFTAVKLYPANATTNSASGVTDMAKVTKVLARLEKIGMPLLLHGEVTEPEIDVFDREAVFIERKLQPLMRDFQGLKIVLEHITTKDAVDFVVSADARLAATITAHHLVINRNALFAGGLRPHMYCLPVAKREDHRLALRQAAISGNPKFFLGTDSAPHPIADKERDCGCAGIFSAPAALEIYAQVFSEENALHQLETFAAESGPRFYGLPLNEMRVTLKRQSWSPPDTINSEVGPVRPFLGGQKLDWMLQA